MIELHTPFKQLLAIDGSPLSGGSVFIGEAGLDAESNQITVYWDEAGTSAATQPIATKSGYLSNAGVRSNIYIDRPYSVTVKDANGDVVYSNLNAYVAPNGYTFDTVAKMKMARVIAGAVVETKGYYAVGDGGQAVYLIKTAADYADTADGYVDHGLANGNVAVLQYQGGITARQVGCLGSGADEGINIQSALDAMNAGGTLDLDGMTILVGRNTGTNDKWGIKVTNNDVTITNGTLDRFNVITSVSDAYPILFVGTPDSNTADAVTGFKAIYVTFVGDDVQHNNSGSAISDFRNAIEFKNTSDTSLVRCTFDDIDSAAVMYQYPGTYDYDNDEYYNTTKNYNSKIIDCDFNGTEHSTAGRAYLHAIVARGIDNLAISNCNFDWCDSAVTTVTTYEYATDTEDDTYTDNNLGESVKRTGRGIVMTGGVLTNSSEHAIYASAMDEVYQGVVLRTDAPSICAGDIKLNSKNVVVNGCTITAGYNGTAIEIHDNSSNVTVSGNNIVVDSDTASGGAISVDSQGLSTYISSRDWLSDYAVMENINISGNTIKFNDSVVTGTNQVGLRVYTDSSDSNYAEGQVRGINFSNNSIVNHWWGVYLINTMFRGLKIDGNIFDAKSFTSSGFSSGTTVNTYAVVGCDSGSTAAMGYATFINNEVNGSQYLFATDDGAGSSVYIPWGIHGNTLNYIKNFKTSDMRSPVQYNVFRDNVGRKFLDRTGWVGAYSLGNSLSSGTSNSERKYNLAYNGTNVIFYTDDSGTTITL